MTRYSDQTEETTPTGERRIGGHLMCMAQDCPLRATITLGGGWLCSYHAFASATRWPSITNKLRTQAAKTARIAIASLQETIRERQDADIPARMRRVQDAVMAVGATTEEVRRRTLKDIHGEEFPEPPEHFAERMDFCLVRLIAPEEEPKKKTTPPTARAEKTVKLDALAAMVEGAMA